MTRRVAPSFRTLTTNSNAYPPPAPLLLDLWHFCFQCTFLLIDFLHGSSKATVLHANKQWIPRYRIKIDLSDASLIHGTCQPFRVRRFFITVSR